MHKNTTQSKSNPPPRRLPPGIAEVVAGWDDLFQQMEKDGCPPDTAASIKQQFEAAFAETREESEWRAFLFHEIRQKLKLLSSSPARALEALEEIDELVSRLPDVDERQDVMRLVGLLGPLREGGPLA